jgi:hypothetical protein
MRRGLVKFSTIALLALTSFSDYSPAHSSNPSDLIKINVVPAEHAGLKISSKLLKLAKLAR